MSSKSKVKVFTPNMGSFDYEGKKYYSHMVVFEDGVAGKCITTTPDGAPWKEGEEVEYELSQDKQGNNKIKRVSQGGAGGGRYKKNEKLECASYSLSYAKDLAVDKVIALDQIVPKAEEFFTWLVAKGEV